MPRATNEWPIARRIMRGRLRPLDDEAADEHAVARADKRARGKIDQVGRRIRRKVGRPIVVDAVSTGNVVRGQRIKIADCRVHDRVVTLAGAG